MLNNLFGQIVMLKYGTSCLSQFKNCDKRNKIVVRKGQIEKRQASI